MELNQKLLGLIEKQEGYAPLQVYNFLQEAYPQLNSKTEIRVINSFRYEFAELPSPIYDFKTKLFNRKGVKARLWRSIGELFAKDKFIRRGKYLDADPTYPPARIKTVTLRPFGWSDKLEFAHVLYVYYYANTDTLLVYE